MRGSKVIHSILLMAGVATGIMDLLAIAIRIGASADGGHWSAASLLVTFPVGLLCLQKLSHRIASAKWS